jgi:hypothetical protein
MSRERTLQEMAIAWAHEWRKGIEDEGALWRRNTTAALPERVNC